MSSQIVPHNKTVVLSTYRNLLRATRIAFQGIYHQHSTIRTKSLTQGFPQATKAHYTTLADSHETHSTRTVGSRLAVLKQKRPSNMHKEWPRS